MVAVQPRVPAKKKYTPRPRSWKSVLLGGKQIRITSSYRSGTAGGLRGGWHTGVDFAAATGTTVRIPLGGRVITSGWNGAYGNQVVVKLNNGDYMRFGHLSSLGVRVGQKVKPGAYIGKSGNTGISSGPHLHLEIMRASSGGRWQRTQSTFYEPISYLNGKAKSVTVRPGSSATWDPTYNGGDDGAGRRTE